MKYCAAHEAARPGVTDQLELYVQSIPSLFLFLFLFSLSIFIYIDTSIRVEPQVSLPLLQQQFKPIRTKLLGWLWLLKKGFYVCGPPRSTPHTSSFLYLVTKFDRV